MIVLDVRQKREKSFSSRAESYSDRARRETEKREERLVNDRRQRRASETPEEREKCLALRRFVYVQCATYNYGSASMNLCCA